MYIYKITDKENGKVYVGQTSQHNFFTRFYDHYATGNLLIDTKLREKELLNFTFEFIDKAETKIELNRKEREWIIKLDSLFPNGYNQTQDMASNPTTEQLDKILKVDESEIKEILCISNMDCAALIGVSLPYWHQRDRKYKEHMFYKSGYEVINSYNKGRNLYYDLKTTGHSIITKRVCSLVGEKADVSKFIALMKLFQSISGLTAKEAVEKVDIGEATFYRYRQLIRSL